MLEDADNKNSPIQVSIKTEEKILAIRDFDPLDLYNTKIFLKHTLKAYLVLII